MSKNPESVALDIVDMPLKVHSTILSVELQNDKWCNVVFIPNLGRLVEIFAWAYRPKNESRNAEPKISNGILLSRDVYVACMNYISSEVMPWLLEKEENKCNTPEYEISQEVFKEPMVTVSATFMIPKTPKSESENRGVRLVSITKYAKTVKGQTYKTSASISFNRVNLDRLIAAFDEVCKKLSTKGTLDGALVTRKRTIEAPTPAATKKAKNVVVEQTQVVDVEEDEAEESDNEDKEQN